ncbi:MAG: response regulator [Elainella sp. C42_A2020_010]|nr:response regulator [Elainella sp. C42_A2020_010]RNJ70263.1 MAG: response regulator [Leptolyngbya sp. IPPAS B-1204]
MADTRKLVLMIQPMSRQGALWQAILRSQGIAVIWEHPDVNLSDSFKHLKSAKVALPDLLLIDTRIQTLNAYSVCRWCRDHYPEVQVVLVNGAQKEITPSEREWAIFQGASDLLPRFQRDRLVSGAVARVKRLLELLGHSHLDSGALVNALIGASREQRSPVGAEHCRPSDGAEHYRKDSHKPIMDL